MKRFFEKCLPACEYLVMLGAFCAVVVLLFVTCVRQAQSQQIDFFSVNGGVQPAAASAPKESSKDDTRQIDFFACEQLPAAPAELDSRSVIHAYGIDNCIPCEAEKKELGDGNTDYRIKWHHDTKGEEFPWYVHNFALHHGYPVHVYEHSPGQWRLTWGRLNAKQMATLAKSAAGR